MSHFGLNKFQSHCSGHASSEDLFRIVEEINPPRLFPVHTTKKELYKNKFDDVVVDIVEGNTYLLT
jgi:mRNA degradation ribonuclease J1/J2